MSLLLVTVLLFNGISGLVKAGGIPVPGAMVTASRGESRFATITNPRGQYFFPDPVDATWAVQIEVSGFVTCQGDGSTASWDLQFLPLEKIDADITTIEAASPMIPVVTQPTFVETKADVSPEPVLADSSPETASSSGVFDNLSQEELDQRAMTSALINGSINNGADSPYGNPSSFGNGRNSRAQYSGNVGLTAGNSVLDARPYSIMGRHLPKANYGNYVAHATLSGLLRAPRIIDARAAYFMISYEHKENRKATTVWGRMPTTMERNGDFSQSVDASGNGIEVRDPFTQLPLEGSMVPEERISTQARRLLKLFPLPNVNGSARSNYQNAVLNDVNQDDMVLRLDNSPSNSKNRFAGNFAFSEERHKDHSIYDFVDTSRKSNLSLEMNWQTNIGRNFSLSVTGHFSRQAADITPYFANRVNVSGDAEISGNNQEASNWGPPNLEFSGGISSLTDSEFKRRRDQRSAGSYAGYLYLGKHYMTFGAGIQWDRFNLLSQEDGRGTFRFTGAATGNDFADFLMGVPETSSVAYGNADKYFRQKLFHAFWTDNWKWTSNFTVNAGLRWEFETPINELRGRLVNLRISPDFGHINPVVGNGLIHADAGRIQPRIGFAWRPGISRMVVRGGYGIYQNTNVYLPIAIQMAQQSPLSKSMISQFDRRHPLTMGNVFAAAQQGASNTFAVDPSFRVGYAQNWQLSIQYDMPFAFRTTVMYMGIKGTYLPQEVLPNTYPLGAMEPSGYAYLQSRGNSNRHAGMIELRRRLRGGLAGEIQYTFSKAIDNAPMMAGGQVVTAGEGGTGIAQNWLDLRAERAVSDFDQRHQVAAQMQYIMGTGLRGGEPMKRRIGFLVRDWAIQGQIRTGSGFSETPIYFAPLNGIGVIGNLRPDYTYAPIRSAPPGLYVNPAAFRIPNSGRWGNAGRNSIPGPVPFSLNASLGRTFPWKGNSIDIRVDAMNVLNHVSFRSWNTVVGSAQFGLPSGAEPMRSIQLTMRLRFGDGRI